MFTVTLRNTPVYDDETLAWLQRLPNAHLLNPRQKRVLAFARKKEMVFTSAKYQRVADADRDTAYQDIKHLRQLAIVRPAAPRARRYIVAAEADLPEPLRALAPVLAEKGFLTNSDVTGHLVLSRSRALRLLRRLVAEGWLQQAGRGRGTRYLPGARFPRG